MWSLQHELHLPSKQYRAVYISLVFVVNDFFIICGSKHKVCESMSAKIGFPPLYTIALAVETNDNDGSITSFPLISISDNAKCNAAVPLLTATHSSEPMYLPNFDSNSATFPTPPP